MRRAPLAVSTLAKMLKPKLAKLASVATIASLAIGLRMLAWPCAPDTWDGVGFVEAVDSFDLASFRPHPPGYPLYVALARLIHLAAVPPLHAVVAASFVLSAMAPLAGYAIVQRAFPTGKTSLPAALLVAGLLAVSPGLVVSSVATMSDGPAVGLALLAYACALEVRPRAPLLTGLVVAAAVGVRPSSALVVLPAIVLLLHRNRVVGVVSGALAAALGALAWIIPTALVIGPRRWLELSRGQLHDHFAHFGESDAVWTQGRSRTYALFEAIGLQLFGFEGRLGCILAASLVVILVTAAVVLAARSTGRAHTPSLSARAAQEGARAPIIAIALVLPATLTIALTQPIGAAPRHALPIAAAMVVVAGLVLASIDRGLEVCARLLLRGLASTSALVCLFASYVAARTHRGPPAPVDMLRYVAHDPTLAHAAVVGGRSSRFSAYGDGARIVPGELAGDAVVFAMRADPFPRPLLITSEIDPRGIPPERLHLLARFTRETPLDRREGTLWLYRFDLIVPH